MSGSANVQSDKCQFGEIAAGRNVKSGKSWSGNCPVGDVSVGEMSSWGTVLESWQNIWRHICIAIELLRTLVLTQNLQLWSMDGKS